MANLRRIILLIFILVYISNFGGTRSSNENSNTDGDRNSWINQKLKNLILQSRILEELEDPGNIDKRFFLKATGNFNNR